MSKPIADLPFPALAELLGSLSPARFFEEHWERALSLLPARSAGEREPFRRQDWRDLAHAARGRGDMTVEILQTGRPRKPESDVEIDAAFHEGASVRIIRVQRVWPFLDQLCQALQWELGFRVSANLYVTPEARQGLDVHADSHDVIVVQMAGGKDWEIFGSPYPLPIDYRAPFVFEERGPRDHRGDEFGGRGYKDQDVGPRLLECSLSPGDLLYVPRGFVHKAVASRGVSVHVTIGLHSTTWGDLLALAVAQESRTEPSLRETLPPGATRVAAPREFVEGELRTRGGRLFERIHGEAVMLETASRFAAARTPSNQSSIVDSDHTAAGSSQESVAAEFDASALYSIAPDAYITFGAEAIDVRTLRAAGLVHTFPALFRPVFDALVQGRVVSPSNLSPLTQRSGEVLLSRLAKAGIVARADQDAG